MTLSVVLVMLVAAVFAINSQEDQDYQSLQDELSALKDFVFNMNVELNKLRKQYEAIRNEQTAVRNRQQAMDTHPITSKSDEYVNYPERIKDDGETTQQNKRATAYNPTLHLTNVWNNTKAQCGSKGEKGDTGLQGPKGDRGTTGHPGPKGTTGSKGRDGINGVAGPKGDTGTPGNRGWRGPTGATGITGPMGPKGNTGNTGTKGQKGQTGNPGTRGQRGEKGNPGTASTPVHQVSFAARKVMRPHRHDKQIVFNKIEWNDGHDYNSSTGVFTCSVPGIYLFTLNVVQSHSDDIEFIIMRNKRGWRYLSVSGSAPHTTESVITMMKLAVKETVSIQRRNITTHNIIVASFEGILLH